MNIKKRIVPIVLFFALIASSIGMGQWIVKAASDTTGPVFQSIIRENNINVLAGGTVSLSVMATDDISVVNRAEVWYVSPSGYACNHATLYPDINGVLKGTLAVNKYNEGGLWKIDYIELYDNAGNKTIVYNSDNYTSGILKDLKAGDFYVLSSLQDGNSPQFNGIAVDKNSAGPGSNVNITISATDIPAGINYAYVSYISSSWEHSKSVMIYPNSTGALKESLQIGQYDEEGKWTVDYIFICDNAGKLTEIYNSEINDDPEVTKQDLSAGDFTVTGTTPDETAPTFQGISVGKSNIYKGDELAVTVNSTDSLSGLDYAVVQYFSPLGNLTNYEILYPDANGNLKGTISTAFYYTEYGKYTIAFVVLVDKAGNWSEIYNSEVITDTSLNLADLSAGDFELFANQDQTAPAGLTGIAVTTHEGTEGKITGTSNLMEYRRSGTSSYTPVTGTEITGLAQGDYYVRFTAREGYNASPEAYVKVKGPEFDVDNGVLLKYNGTGGDVVIPDNLGITSISGNVFSSCYNLTGITIPNGVTSIGENAFYNCISLTTAVLPNSLTSIGYGAFERCDKLANIVLPTGLTSIDRSAFADCNSLTSITIPSSVTSIGGSAFSSCDRLTSISMPDGITSISYDLFSYCRSLTSITIPSGVTSIGGSAFSDCGLTSITIPSGVTSIGGSAFNNCNNLTSVTIPGGVTKLESYTFSSCDKLKSVTLPSGLLSIGGSAFSGCGSLTSIVIPNSVTSIGYSAFSFCISLTSVSLPSAITSIEDSIFYYCNSLSTINSFAAIAPKINSNIFDSIASNAVINIVPGATGYNALPWSKFVQKTMALPVTSIEVKTLPIKTKYFVGDSLNITGIAVTATYEGDVKSQRMVTEANVSGFNSSSPVEGQILTVSIDGKTTTFNVDILAQPTETASTGNLAAGKLCTSSKQYTQQVFMSLNRITDGDKNTNNFAEDWSSAGGVQYVQVDLGAPYDINNFKLWHYYGDNRKYNDVVVIASNDPTFATGVTTLFNNDKDNSLQRGNGIDREYYETASGLDISFTAVNARYVRFYSNGSNKNINNHYVEAEIYGVVPAVHPDSLTLSKATAAVETGSTYSLAATVLPAETTNKSVTWSSSDTSVATVSANGVVTGVKAGTATITATTVDGQIAKSCDFTVIAAAKNLSNGKQFTSTVFNGTSSITDGNKSLSSMADDYPNGGGLQYVQMDLGAYYDLSKINLWHYYGDGRKYKDVIVQVSNDPTFATDVTTVYNNDTNNSAGLGAGTEVEYAETSAGKNITIDMVNARYVRLYSNGSDKNTSNHYVEAEVYGFDGPVVTPASLTLDKDAAALAVGGTSTLTAKVMPLNTTDKSVTWSSSDAGIATVSSSGAVTGVAAGKAIITATTADGKLEATCEVTVTVAPSNLSAGKLFTSPVFKDLARVTDGSKSTGSFSEDYPNGGGLQYMQLDLGAYYDLSNIKLWHYYGDGRKYKDVIVQVSNDLTFATDVTTVYSNDTDNSAKLGTGNKAEYAETSAGLDIPFDAVNARYVRLYSNGSNLNSSNHYVEVEVYGLKGAVVHPSAVTLSKSTMKVVEGATDSLSAAVMPLNTTDKSVTWSSSDESVATVSAAGEVTGVKAGTATITATTVDGSVEGTCAVTVSPAPLTSNLSAGKLFTSSVFTGLSKITDGSKSTGSFAEDYPNGGGLQYVQMDLGAYYDLSDIKLWHYYGDGRKYKDVIVQVSNDPTFATDVTTVYSNDTNNSAGLGAGTAAEYAETSAGLDIPFDAVNARYVRLYSNGSDKNASNHYVEAEVYGAKGAVVHPSTVSLSKTTDTLSIGATDTLTAKVMPLNTTDKSVTWSSDNTGIATVSATGVVSGVAAGTATITATTADGSKVASCAVTVTEAPLQSDLTAGKLFTSSVFKDLGRITDGNRSTGSFSEDYPAGGGLQYVQIDLAGNYNITEIDLWHYYGDARKYKDVIVQVSNDPTFKTGVKTIYNNDKDNSAGRGVGTDSEYAEGSEGLNVYTSTSGRYVRFYSNGSTANSNNHYVEIRIFGFKSNVVDNQAAGKTLTSSVNFVNLARVADGSKSTGSFSEDYPAGGGLQWVQADLGISYDISEIKLWHYFGDSRTYHDVVVQVSDDPTFKTGVTTVYNNDADGSAGLGTGTAVEYAETSEGLDIPVTSVTGRYVRFYSNGSTANSNNHYVEFGVYGK